MDKVPYKELKKWIADARAQVTIGSKWRHYKGPEYVIADIAIIEATNEVSVIYTSVDHPSVSFVRPLKVWLESVEVDGESVPRFARVS